MFSSTLTACVCRCSRSARGCQWAPYFGHVDAREAQFIAILYAVDTFPAHTGSRTHGRGLAAEKSVRRCYRQLPPPLLASFWCILSLFLESSFLPFLHHPTCRALPACRRPPIRCVASSVPLPVAQIPLILGRNISPAVSSTAIDPHPHDLPRGARAVAFTLPR
ncbi:hypothetical protein DFH09DRAFT_1362186 [Mycena vulgaris]|nr:hypothetical protein DFH09DRAFT_1362186 [Mycena vulgaris]